MKHIDRKRVIKELKKLLKKVDGKNIIVVIDSRGKGSHFSLIFIDEDTEESIPLTFADTKEISPGVQRRTLETLGKFADFGNQLAVLLKEVFEQVFK